MLRIYKVTGDAVNKVKQVVATDPFARIDYKYREGFVLGIAGEDKDYYLYLKGPDEFFAEHAKELEMDSVEELSGEVFDKVREAVEKEEDSVAAGVALFD